MNNSIFRKSSIDRVQSPEQLNDYIKVSNPSAWVIIIAAIVLLGAVLVWSIFGTVELNKTVSTTNEKGQPVTMVVSKKINPIKFMTN